MTSNDIAAEVRIPDPGRYGGTAAGSDPDAEQVPIAAPLFTPVSEALASVAAAYGVATEYFDQAGQLQEVGADTVRAVLAAFDVDTTTDDDCRAALRLRRAALWEQMLPDVVVLRRGAERTAWVHHPASAPVRVWVELDDGTRRYDLTEVGVRPSETKVNGELLNELEFRFPNDLPLGWHRLHAESSGRSASAPLVVTPDRLAAVDPGWGLSVQLYSVRSARSWGVGDLADLGELAEWSGLELGADFVQINPLHAASPRPPMAPSPYLPATRRFANPIYIRVEQIREYAYLPPAAAARVRELAAQMEALDRSPELLDRDAVWAAKSEALGLIFAVPRQPGSQASLDAFLAEEGDGLRNFATWCALVEEHGSNFRKWPEKLQNPASPAVAQERERLSDRVEFYGWLQWVLDSQLGQVQRRASEAGMSLGVIHDLAVGVHPRGADAWALQDVLAQGISVGAPPDMYNQLGQNWSQPPWRPDRLAEAGYLPYRDMLRTILRHGGALRFDHILGLFRMWWVPEGMPAYAGTYVRFDHDALVDILVLEAHLAGAAVIGEDLGTVEAWVREFLAERGVLGTTILWFERGSDGINAPEHWRQEAMTSVTVHDLPPTAAYLAGEHVKIRHDLSLLRGDFADEWAGYIEEVAAWRTLLAERGMLAPGAGVDDTVVALHELAALSPSRLLAVSLADVVGDVRAQNQPGTDQEYPNWRVPLCDARGRAVLIEDLPDADLLPRLVNAVRGTGARG